MVIALLVPFVPPPPIHFYKPVFQLLQVYQNTKISETFCTIGLPPLKTLKTLGVQK